MLLLNDDSTAARAARTAAKVLGAFAFRFACLFVMLWLAFIAEARTAPVLPDWGLSHLPYVYWLERYNFLIWTIATIPIVIALGIVDAGRLCRMLVSDGILSVIRGFCIAATGLGPVKGIHAAAGQVAVSRWESFRAMLSVNRLLFHNEHHAYLTKDLFFSGHTSTTALLLFYVWRFPRLRRVMLTGHLAVVASVLLGHLHYTIDVLGAYPFALGVFALRELGWARIMGTAPTAEGQGAPANRFET